MVSVSEVAGELRPLDRKTHRESGDESMPMTKHDEMSGLAYPRRQPVCSWHRKGPSCVTYYTIEYILSATRLPSPGPWGEPTCLADCLEGT